MKHFFLCSVVSAVICKETDDTWGKTSELDFDKPNRIHVFFHHYLMLQLDTLHAYTAMFYPPVPILTAIWDCSHKY